MVFGVMGFGGVGERERTVILWADGWELRWVRRSWPREPLAPARAIWTIVVRVLLMLILV